MISTHRCVTTIVPGPADEFLDTVYKAAAKTWFGLLTRNSDDWSALRRAGSADLRRDVVGCAGADGSVGYAILAHQTDPNTGHLAIEVVELLHNGSGALLGLLNYLASHNNVTRLRWDAPIETQLWTVTAKARTWEPQVCLDKMVRVVNLGTLTIPLWSAPDMFDPVLLDVVDPQAPWNAGYWAAVPEGGEVHFERATVRHLGTPIQVQASALAPLLLGGANPDWLGDSGLLTAPNPAELDRLRQVTLRPSSPYCPSPW
jgi:predicted acetyltransferase